MAGLESHLRGLSLSSSQLKQAAGSSPVAGRPAVPLPTSAALVETQPVSSPSRVKNGTSSQYLNRKLRLLGPLKKD